MSGIRVVTDSAADLPAATAVEHNIEIVPLTIRFGDEEFVDGRDLSPKEFWARCANSPVLPETAAPSPGQFEAAFRRAADAGADGVVCVNLSAELSATYQAAQLAAEAVKADVAVRVVDGRTLTMAQGLIAIAGAQAAAEGKSLDEVEAAVERQASAMRVIAALDTLENLKKGGRVSGVQAMLGSMLSIKPIVRVVDGKVVEEAKQRTRSRSLQYVVDKVKAEGGADADFIAVMHGDAPDIDDFVEMLTDAIDRPREDMLVADVGAVIGTHAGPRVIGVGYSLPQP